MYLVVVESPAKAKTIKKYLGSDYQVIASYGHIRDLPSKVGSVDPDNNFSMIYQISEKAKKHVKAISILAKKANKIFLATDPDREGESISWHIIEALKEERALKKNTDIKRVVFNEITKSAVNYAIDHPRDIDEHLVDAQQARRALDYLVGFNLSPILWRKLPGSKSAGRVQSVALRMICDREKEIEAFSSREFWDIKIDFNTQKQEKITAIVTHIDKKKLDKFDINSQAQAIILTEKLNSKNYIVADIEKKQLNRKPLPPFITSSLQQEASRKLGFSTKYTMQLAQKLYEGVDISGESVGLITYMRTDGVYLSKEAIDATRNFIKLNYGDKYLPSTARIFKSKAKNAQEAHEAIRPTNIIDYRPEKISELIDKDLFRLYELIWKRTVASQMENAILDLMSIIIESKDGLAMARASGSNINFDGFYKLYKETLDDQEAEEYKILPNIDKSAELNLIKVMPAQHFTEPPPRFSEASLVKKMEELGIGRPSTYSSIISVIQDRQYVKLDKKRFIPEDRGMIVTSFLVNFFKKYVEYDFTASLEDQLDEISAGQMQWQEMLSSFWQDFINNVNETGLRKNSEIIEVINQSLENHFFKKDEEGNINKNCPNCLNGQLSIKLGKYGAFFSCSCYPECNYIKSVIEDKNIDNSIDSINEEHQDQILGIHQKSGENIILKKGPYGFYLQLGNDLVDKSAKKTKKIKPRRCSIPSFLEISTIDFNKASYLISMPIEIGLHPETQKSIKLSIGKFGPYLLCDEKFFSLPKNDEIFDLSLQKAVEVIERKNNLGSKRKTPDPIAFIGKHPENDQEINIFQGKFSPYIKYNNINIAIPKKYKISDINMQIALELIKKHSIKKESEN